MLSLSELLATDLVSNSMRLGTVNVIMIYQEPYVVVFKQIGVRKGTET